MDLQDNVTFQILDWNFYQEDNDDGGKNYTIRLFGKTRDQQTIYTQVEGFQPFFFVEIDRKWRGAQISQILEQVKKRIWPKECEKGLVKTDFIDKYKFRGFTNYKKFNFLHLTFSDLDSMRAYERAFSKKYKMPWLTGKKPLKFRLYESNIAPFLRFMHMRQLEAVGWVTIPKSKLEKFSSAPTCCQQNYRTNWKSVKKVEDRNIEKFVIASFDIECTSEDGSFPKPERDGDKVIQIGMTLSRFGEDECFAKYILCLHKTDPIEGVDVRWYEDEEDLLLGWTKLMRETNPDIVTGYNIFGFDYDYLKRRSEKLDIYARFSRLSRVNNEESRWIDTVLSSSALGENKLKYFDMVGRVNIDLMKVVQRDHKLSSYKLDDVAANFIKDSILELVAERDKNDPNIKLKRDAMMTDFVSDNIKKIEKAADNTYIIKTKNTYGLSIDQYVNIAYSDGLIENKYMDGKKYKIKALTKDTITIEGEIDISDLMGKGYKVFWSQTKDDIGPNDIFRLFKGSSADRAIVAKYCVQDCQLVSRLINKLQVVTNNVGMANVCNVPLSYLFLRGQGVKIFSLVAKKCREENHLIPVLKKKIKKEEETKNDKDKTPQQIAQEKEDKALETFVHNLNNKNQDDDSDDEEDVGYEGATVFPPKKGAHFEPVTVWDFESLYPNAMILRNLSHECFVDDPAYDNLAGYIYHQITYRNNDGTETTCRFAEKEDGTKGIIPKILMDLLSARKATRKLIETEKDAFKRSILDSLQLAYKITANSLYGQTGASTSAICMKQIAASTTATGREALQFSKHFAEKLYADMIKLALVDKKKYLKKIREIYEFYPHKIDVCDVVVDDKTGNETKNKYQIHVNTVENAPIPESKFILPEIGYEIDCKLYDDYKKTSKFYDDNKDLLTSLGYETAIMFNEKFVKNLSNSKVADRKTFVDGLKTLVIEKRNKKSKFYASHEALLTNMGLTEKLFGKMIKALLKDEEKGKKIVTIIEDNVRNMGYVGRDELFEKFYQIANELLNGHSVNPEVIYGDSVKGDEALVLKDKKTGKIVVKRIDELCDEWASYDGFKTDDANEYFVDIVRQLLKPDVTQNEFSDLLNMLPKNVYQYVETHKAQSEDTVIENIKMILETNNKNRHQKQQAKTAYLVWSGTEWTEIKRVIRHKTNKKIHRVITNTSIIDVTEDHSLIDAYGNYIRPGDCNEQTLLMQSYPKNVKSVRALKKYDIDEFISDAKVECTKYYIQAKNKEYNVAISYKDDKFVLKRTKDVIVIPNKIVKIIPSDGNKEEYVYDLETKSGKFHAGIGELIVKNTDSVFYKMNVRNTETGIQLRNKKELEMCISLGIWGSILICTLLPAPMKMAYEKSFFPFAIISKKRYVGNLYEKNPNKFYQKSMGLVLKRRDNAPIVKIVCGGIVNQLLNNLDKGAEGALNFARKTLKEIVTGKYKLDKFVISKTLRSEYANRNAMVHAVLADRMAERDPGNKPQSNDRIPYAFVEVDKEVEVQGDRVEHPDYIKKKGLKLDYLFYITNQIMKPCMQFLELILENPDQIFREYIIKEENRKKCMMPMGYYFNEDKNEKEKDQKDQKVNFDQLVDENPDETIAKVHKKIKYTEPEKRPKKSTELVDFDEIANDINGSHKGKDKSDSPKDIIRNLKSSKVKKVKKTPEVKKKKSFKQFIGKNDDECIDFDAF